MKYYLIAGEASGDVHGANLMRGKAHQALPRFGLYGLLGGGYESAHHSSQYRSL